MDSDIQQITHVLDYAGKAKRQGELFQKGSFFKKIKQNVNSVFLLEAEQNVFLQTRPYLATLVEQLQKGQLSQ